MKKRILAALCVVVIALLTACGNSGSTETNASTNSPYTVQQEAKEQISNEIWGTITDEDKKLLYGSSEAVMVTIANGEVSVTVRVAADYAIPSAVECIIPVCVAAIENTDYPLNSVSVQSYIELSGEIATESLVSWRSTDGEIGTFVTSSSGTFLGEDMNDLHKTGCTAADLYDLYINYYGESYYNTMVATLLGD